MIDFDYESEEEKEERRKKEGEGKKEGAGALGRAKAPVSDAAFELMKKFGLPKEKIAEILRTWAHLVGDQLVRRLAEYGREGLARASAHIQVLFDAKKGFAIVTNFLAHLTERNVLGLKASPDQTPKPR